MPATSVYSTVFMIGFVRNAAEGAGLTYTVPAGKIAIVRSVDFWCYLAGAVMFGRKIAGSVYPITSSQGIPALGSRTWEGHQVFPSGSVMSAQWISGDVTVNVSGFLLNTQA